MKVFVTGGLGYTGSMLVKALSDRGDQVVVLDTAWFGDWLGELPGVTKIRGDIRNPEDYPNQFFDAVVHLANIANDPGVELYPELSWEVNVLASKTLCDWAVKQGIPHVIFASSGSVYGVKEEERVTEDLDLVPISTYNKTKMVAERVFLSYQDSFKVHLIRPATVCGLSPRMRLDLTVNLLTFQALSGGFMTVFGGSQVRPSVYIKDLVNAYMFFIDSPEIDHGAYNVAFENNSVLGIAELISEEVPASIRTSSSTDPRSYRQDSSKLLELGFQPTGGIRTAVSELVEAYNAGHLIDREEWHSIKALARHFALGSSEPICRSS